MELDFRKKLDINKNILSNNVSNINYITNKNVQHFITLIESINNQIVNDCSAIMLIDDDLTSLSVNIINKPVNLITYKLVKLHYADNYKYHQYKYILSSIILIPIIGFVIYKINKKN